MTHTLLSGSLFASPLYSIPMLYRPASSVTSCSARPALTAGVAAADPSIENATVPVNAP
jgi:hypothetical protein